MSSVSISLSQVGISGCIPAFRLLGRYSLYSFYSLYSLYYFL